MNERTDRVLFGAKHAVFEANSRRGMWFKPPILQRTVGEKLTIAEHAYWRSSRPNERAKSAVGGPQRRFRAPHGHLVVLSWRTMEFQTFQHQRRIRRQQGNFLCERFGTQLDHRPEAVGSPDG